MGEVYRARDTRLDRIVAIKVLPSHVAADPLFRQRFQREAKTISSLDHPHICALYDLGDYEGTHFLVMQYLEGETLADRLAKGPLPIGQALKYAMEIADGLDRAHRQGFVHRDLKPGNVMLATTDAGRQSPPQAKLLDFGLAKALGPRKIDPSLTGAGAELARPDMATVTGSDAMTVEGTVIGTPSYMAPEQLEGKEADGRSDIFAFGCVLYEMLTGKRAFTGDSRASLIAAILDRDPPPIAEMQPAVTPAVDHIVRRALAKQPDDRFQTARDLLLELKWVAEEHPTLGMPPVTAPTTTREWLLATLLVIAVAAALGVAALHFFERPAARSSIHFDVLLPGDLTFENYNDAPIISPDGRLVVFSAARAGTRHLWIRPLDSRAITMLEGTEGGSNPFWSDDSRSIGFFAAGKLKRVTATGGPVVTVCDSERTVYSSGSWNRDGVILFAGAPGGIYRVPEGGGVPQAATNLAGDEKTHTSPAFLPDGRRFLYVASGARPGIYTASLDAPEIRGFVIDAAMASYVDPEYLLFTRGQTLFAQRFDPQTLQLREKPVPLVEAFWSQFSVSRNGVLAYRPGSMYALSRFAWIGREGKRLGAVGEAGRYMQMALSPSGRKMAIQRREEGNNYDLWLLDLATNVLSRLTSDPEADVDPVWSPDEQRIVFSSRRTGVYTLFQKDLMTGKEERLLADPPQPGAVIDDWSPDGRFVIFRNMRGSIYTFSMEGERTSRLIDDSRYVTDQSHVSPDGKWIAFHANESGRYEVYLATFPAFTDKRQVSRAGGLQPMWRSDGKELFYLEFDGRLMALPVKTRPDMEIGMPSPLFQTNIRPAHLSQYAVAPGGQRFLVLEPERTGGEPMTIVLDWTTWLDQK